MQCISHYYYTQIKGSVTQKQRPHEVIWTLWFDKKVYPMGPCAYDDDDGHIVWGVNWDLSPK